MSIPVELGALPEQIAALGARALLITTTTDGPPHVASVLVTVVGTELSMGAGRKTRANLLTHPAVALVWPERPGTGHCLIVDAVAQEAPTATLLVRPTSAVLHRLTSDSPA